MGDATGTGNRHAGIDLDQVRIFNKAISSSEVTTLYNETKNTTNTLQILGDTSCIATYPLDGSSTDLSGNYSGTDTNILYKYDATPTNVDFGIGGKTLYGARFNGSNSYVDLPLTSIFGGKNTLAVSFWFKTTTTARQRMFTDYAQSSRNCDITIDGGNIEIVTDYGSTSDKHTTSSTYNDDNWHHIVVSINQSANQRTIYIDGLLVDSITLPSQSWNGSGQKVTIGAFYSSSSGYSQYFDGEIDQVRLFSKALSSDEVGKLYGNGAGEIACTYTSTTDNVAYPIANTAYYKLDNNSKDSARSTGKFNEGAIFNGSNSKISLSTISNIKTYSFWINPDSSGNPTYARRIFGNIGGTSYTYSIVLDPGFGAAGQGRMVYYENTSAKYGDIINFDEWSHIAFTSDGTTLKIYTNGSLSNTYTTSSFVSSINEICSTASNRQFKGKIDQVRIYNTALDSTDVSNLYAETVNDTSTLSFPSGKTAIAAYQLDGNSTDLSGNYNGTDTNITYAYDGTDSNIEYRFGRFGQAAVFNGSSSVFDTNLSVPTNWTVSLWLKRTPNGYFGGTTNSSVRSGVYFYSNSNGRLQIYNRNSSGGNIDTLSTSTGLVTEGNWHHIAITFDSTSGTGLTTVYVDSVNAGTLDGTPTHSTDFKFGRSGDYAVEYFNGSIDQVRIFNSALSASNVTDLYNEKPEVDTSNFKTVLYEGNGSTQYISNVGFGPSLTWIKARSVGYSHSLQDTLRGPGTSTSLYPDLNSAQGTYGGYGQISSFDIEGFTVASGGHGTYPVAQVNQNGVTYVAWCWKAGGTAVTNNEGAVTSQVSANTAAGFSIVGGSGNTYFGGSLGHGLNQPPELIIYKDLANANNWYVYHKDLTTPNTYYLHLDLDNAQANYSSVSNLWDVTSTTFSTSLNITRIGIAYCWHSVAGYSRIGSYTSTGQVGKRIYVTNDDSSTGSGGFKPSFVMMKAITSFGSNQSFASWAIYDNKRAIESTDNVTNPLYANRSYQEGLRGQGSSGSGVLDLAFNDDGFTINHNGYESNANGGTYIYMAFK